MVTKKVRTEYMKKFKDPKWETFSKCYEDSLKYRLTRRVMEHSHKPWFWEGWDSSSDSSGWSTPRLTRNRVAPLSVAPPDTSEVTQKLMELKTGPGPRQSSDGQEPEVEPGGGGGGDGPTTGNREIIEAAVVENGPRKANVNVAAVPPIVNGFHSDVTTDNGPIDSVSSDGDVIQPKPRQRPRRRVPRSEPTKRDASHGNDKPAAGLSRDVNPAVVRKAPRAKSQPPASSKERLDWSQTQVEARRTPNDSHTSDACIQTGRPRTGHHSSGMRRARSADLDKIRKSQLAVVDERWTTEYMRCFSARLR